MTEKYLLGLDVGGGGGRCLLVNTATGDTFSVFRAWSMPSDPQAGGFSFKLDTDTVWRVLGETAQDALRKAGATPQEVVGLAAASMRHGLVAIDKKGKVLLATPNRDARSVDQGMGLALERGEELYGITGHSPSPIFMAARLMWLKENHPDDFKSVHAALSISDWVGYMLTGELASEPAQAAESLLFDLKTRKWSGPIIKSLGLPEKIFPGLKTAGTKLGRLTNEAASHLGLAPGTPVAVGGPDTQCGLLGMGVTSAGQIGVIAGTTTPIQMAVRDLVIDPQMRTWTGLHVIPGLYVLESNAGQTGVTLEWIARLMHSESPNPVARLCAEAEASVPGAHGMYSTIGASVFNASALEPPVDNLTFSSVIARPGEQGQADTARAVLEGMAYAVRANIEQIMNITGGSLSQLRLGGGISRSALWTGIISDLMQCNVQVSASTEATALGATICAGVGAGLYPDLITGAQKISRLSREHIPSDSSTYQNLYAEWQSLRKERRPADMLAASNITSVMMAGLTAGDGLSAVSASFRPRIYISAEVDEVALSQLREIGEVTYKPYRTEGILLTGDDLVQTLKDTQVFVTEVDIVDAECLQKLPDLRMIVVCRGNPVNIDIDACTAASIPVTNTPARNADAVADLAISFILMLARRLQPASGFLRQPGGEAGDLGRMGQAHEEFLGMELWRKTIGVVGGGAIGRKVVQRLLPFGARVLLFDPYLAEGQVELMGAEKASFERLMAESDFISLHAPVSEETRDMLDAKAFDLMKPGAFLVNTARAALVNEGALLASLRSGKLGGYATDVFSVEPPAADDPLLSFPNVIGTPHVGGNTLEVAAHQGEIIYNELRLLLAGKRPKHILNPATLETFAWTGKRQTDENALRKRSAAPGPAATDLDAHAQSKQSGEIVTNRSDAVQNTGTTSGKVEVMETNGTRKKMVGILKEFTASIAADSDMAAFAKGRNVVFSFTIKDLEQAFFLSFVDGNVDAGLGNPPRDADVRLKMSADTLDGMFTGRVNATKAATSGKLSFSGDTGKAMAFIRIQGNMGRLYTAARQKIGDPGDLTKIGIAPAAAQPVAQSPAPAPAPAAGTSHISAPAVVKTGDVRDQILQVTSELFFKGMITATGGNVSARCDDNPNEIWITPSAIFKGDLRPDMMVRIDLDGRILNDTDYTASSERRVHCEIYRNQPDITAVIHTHAPQATLMALTGTKFLPISADAAFFGDIPVVPFIMPGTDELGREVARAMSVNGIAVLMQNHGLVVAGSSLRRAADMTDMIEVTAHKLLTCRMLGVQPALLPEDIVKELKTIGASLA